MSIEKSSFSDLLSLLMRHYQHQVPTFDQILDLLLNHNIITSSSDIENDHIAFRSFKDSRLGIHSLEKIFLHYGYKKEDTYHFEKKHLSANWYSPPDPNYPRIFISELLLEELSTETQSTLQSYLKPIGQDPVDLIELNNVEQVAAYLHSLPWKKPSWKDYQALAQENEYAAWVLCHGHQFNHFTFSVHNLPSPYDSLSFFNDFLENNHFKLNDAGGKIKTSKDGKLLQSSTVAHLSPYSFDKETHDIAGSFVEFAERKVLDTFKHLEKKDIQHKHRREGFEVANADKIFESTYSNQIKL